MDLKDIDGYIVIALGFLGVAWLAWASRQEKYKRHDPVEDPTKK